MSIVDTVKSTISAVPGSYLLVWLAGVPVEKWAAFAALLCSLWVLYDRTANLIRKWHLKRKIRHDDAERRHARNGE